MLVTTKSKAKNTSQQMYQDTENRCQKNYNIKTNRSLNVPDHFKSLSLICYSSSQSLENEKRKKQ